MKKDYDSVSFEVQTLSKMIELNNGQYLRREDDLSREIARLSQEVSQPLPRLEETHDEKQRRRRAQELSKEIDEAQTTICTKRSEEELAGIAVSRLTQHASRYEDRAHQICACISEPLQKAIAVLDESVASRQNIQSFLNINGGTLASPPAKATKTGLQQQLAPKSIELEQKSKHCLWYLSQIGEALRGEGELRAERYSTLNAAHTTSSEQLQNQANVLMDAQSALSALQLELQKINQMIAAKETLVQKTAQEGDSRRSSEPSLQSHQLEIEKELRDLEKDAESVESTLTREKQRLARLENEKKDLLESEQKELATLDHYVSLLDLCKKSKIDAESTRSSLTKSLQQLDIGRSNSDRELQKLRSAVTLAEEDQSSSRVKVREMEDQLEKLASSLRQAQRDAEAKKSFLAAREGRVDALSKEKGRLEEKLQSLKADRTSATQAVLQVKATLSNLQQQESNTVRELQYLHSLLPRGHPSAKLSRLLEDRRVADGLSPENLRDLAVSKKPLLVAQAKSQVASTSGPPSNETEPLRKEILTQLQKRTPVNSRSSTPHQLGEVIDPYPDFFVQHQSEAIEIENRVSADMNEVARGEARSTSASISEINQKLQQILSKRQTR